MVRMYGQVNPGHSWEYRDYINSLAWAERAARAREDAFHECEVCGETYLPLQVHHLTYYNLGAEPAEDLLVLCEYCHELADDQRRWDLDHPEDRNEWIRDYRRRHPGTTWGEARKMWVIQEVHRG